MSQDKLLDKVKELRELTGVGFKDCKNAIDENNGDIEKSIEYLRKKGIAKANKKMERVAAEGLVCIHEKDNNFSILEVNSETDFVAKNIEFMNFVEEVTQLGLSNLGIMKNLLDSKMTNNKSVNENLISLISKIGEKITIRRINFIESDKFINFSYTHLPVKKNLGKIGVLLSIETNKKSNEIVEFGKKLSMHIAATSPLAIDVFGLDQNIIKKEKEIILEEIKNSGKDPKIAEKIALGKLNKFTSDNTLLNQEWIMEPKLKVKDVLNKIANKDKIRINKFIRFKVGEGI